MTGDFSIALTVRSRRVAFTDVTVSLSPTPRWRSLARPSSTIAPSSPSVESTLSEPCAQSNVNRPETVFGSIELIVSFPPNTSPPSWRIAVTAVTPGVAARARATAGSVGDQPSAPVTTWVAARRRSAGAGGVARHGGGGRRPAVGTGHHGGGGDGAIGGAGRAVAQALGDDRPQGPQRDADHQRRRGDGRGAGVAHRVAARQPAGRAAEPL